VVKPSASDSDMNMGSDLVRSLWRMGESCWAGTKLRDGMRILWADWDWLVKGVGLKLDKPAGRGARRVRSE